jgi:hypothetical protein
MCKSLDKRQISNCGIFWSIFFGCIGISSLVLSIIQFPYTRLHWMNKGSWRHLGGLGISAVSVLFVFCILSIITFILFIEKKIILLIYCITELAASIYVLFVSIFSLIGAQRYRNEKTDLCEEQLSGFFSHFLVLDDYFHIVDNFLCSESCECVFSNKSAYQEFSTINIANPEPQIVSDQWQYMKNHVIYNKKGNKTRAYSFSQCSDDIQALAKSYFIDEIIAKNNTDVFEINNFYNYWKRIEEKFKCTGWCNNKYLDTNNEERIVAKYLFSNIDGGIVKNRGCMKLLSSWLTKIINGFGSTLLCAGFFMLFPLIFSICLYFGYYNYYDEDYNYDNEDKEIELKGDN